MNLFYPISFFLLCGFLVVLPVFDAPLLVAVDLLILLVGVLVYLVFIRWKRKPAAAQKFLREWVRNELPQIKFTIMLSLSDMMDLGFQKLFLAVPDESELPPSITITPASDDGSI